MNATHPTVFEGIANVVGGGLPDANVKARSTALMIIDMQYVDAHRDYDGAIIFTDGHAPIPRMPQNRRTRVLWLFNTEAIYRAMHPALRAIGRAAFLREV